MQAHHADQLPHFVHLLIWRAPVATCAALVDNPSLSDIDAAPVVSAALAHFSASPDTSERWQGRSEARSAAIS